MKSTLCSVFLKITSLIVLLTFYFGSSTYGQGRDRNVLSLGPVRPGNLDYRTELPQGYLKVYSATDEFNDGDAWYFPHSPYVIYTIGGKLFKNVANQRSPADEVPEVVALPVGTYAIVARSERDGYGRVLVVIKEGQQTILDLTLWEKKTQTRLAHN
jgi:hypothetical protein